MRNILRRLKMDPSFYLLILTAALLMALLPSFALGASGDPGFSAGIMASVGSGPMGNGSDVATRSMLYTPISVFAGYNYRKIRLGLQYENDRAGQTADTPDVSGQDISGSGNAPGVRLDYYDGLQSAGVIYRLNDTYVLNSATIQGANTTYKAQSGFTVQYYRQFRNHFGFVIDYTTEQFNESLANKIKWTRIGVGLVFTNFMK